MDLRSVLAIAATAAAAAQAEDLERELHEFELEAPPEVEGAPWLLRPGKDFGEDPFAVEH